MFGKPEWFEFRLMGLSVRPVRWQGWVYVLVWTLALLVPFWVLLFFFQRPLWGLVWLGLAVSLMAADAQALYRRRQSRIDEKEWDDRNDSGARR